MVYGMVKRKTYVKVKRIGKNVQVSGGRQDAACCGAVAAGCWLLCCAQQGAGPQCLGGRGEGKCFNSS
jgi:hypothetical protein